MSECALGTKVLVAGVGNIFLSDDGFGSAVAQALSGVPLPDGVEVADVGIRGVHLAYQLLDGYDALVFVDAMQRREAPGTITVLEPDLARLGSAAAAVAGDVPIDAHGMAPVDVLGLLARLAPTVGESVGRVLVVGCEPDTVEEGMGLSSAVDAAVPRAVDTVMSLLERGAPTSGTKEERHEPSADGSSAGDGRSGNSRDVAGHPEVRAHPGDVTGRPASAVGRS